MDEDKNSLTMKYITVTLETSNLGELRCQKR